MHDPKETVFYQIGSLQICYSANLMFLSFFLFRFHVTIAYYTLNGNSFLSFQVFPSVYSNENLLLLGTLVHDM